MTAPVLDENPVGGLLFNSAHDVAVRPVLTHQRSDWRQGQLQTRVVDGEIVGRKFRLTWRRAKPGFVRLLEAHYARYGGGSGGAARSSFACSPPGFSEIRALYTDRDPVFTWRNGSADATVEIEEAIASD